MIKCVEQNKIDQTIKSRSLFPQRLQRWKLKTERSTAEPKEISLDFEVYLCKLASVECRRIWFFA